MSRREIEESYAGAPIWRVVIRERPSDDEPVHQLEWIFDGIIWAFAAGYNSLTLPGRFPLPVEYAIMDAGFGVARLTDDNHDIGVVSETCILFLRTDDYVRDTEIHRAEWWDNLRRFTLICATERPARRIEID